MVYSAGEIVDMPVMEFQSYISTQNVNTAGAVSRLLTMVRLDLEKALLGYRNDLLRKSAEKIVPTKDEIVEYTVQIASIGAMIRIIDEKKTLADFKVESLTPDCFRKKEEAVPTLD